MKIEYQIIKNKNNCFNTDKQFEHLLQSTDSFNLNEKKKTIKFEDIEIKYNMEQYEANTEEVIFDIVFDVEREENIEKFERFDTKFLNIVKAYSNDERNIIFINTLIDEISKYYGQQMYLMINEIESKLRKMIYLFMVKNVGTNWMEISVPENLHKKNEIKKEKNKDKENINNKEEESKSDYLIETDFNYLINFLFEKYPNVNSKKMMDEIERKETLSQEQIKDLIEKYKYKSNWERYFSQYSKDEEIKNNLKKLYEYRNKVAHNKKIRKVEYEVANKLTDYLNEIFDRCLKNISDIEVPDKEKENLENIGNSMINNAYLVNENILKPINTAYSALISNLNLAINDIPKIEIPNLFNYNDFMLEPNYNISIGENYMKPLESQIRSSELLGIKNNNME